MVQLSLTCSFDISEEDLLLFKTHGLQMPQNTFSQLRFFRFSGKAVRLSVFSFKYSLQQMVRTSSAYV